MAASFELCFMATFLRGTIPNRWLSVIVRVGPKLAKFTTGRALLFRQEGAFFSPSASGSGNVQQTPLNLPESWTNETRSTDADGEGNVQHHLLPNSCTTRLDKTAFIDGNEGEAMTSAVLGPGTGFFGGI